MKFFFDTSVLIPAFFEDHQHHERSLDVFLKADKKQACCGAHSLLEFYATTTRFPGRHRLTGDQVLLLLDNIQEKLAIVTLEPSEYYAMLKEAAQTGIVGATIYDLLLAQCALKAGAEIVYTWNVRDFQRFGPQVAERIRTP